MTSGCGDAVSHWMSTLLHEVVHCSFGQFSCTTCNICNMNQDVEAMVGHGGALQRNRSRSCLLCSVFM